MSWSYSGDKNNYSPNFKSLHDVRAPNKLRDVIKSSSTSLDNTKLKKSQSDNTQLTKSIGELLDKLDQLYNNNAEKSERVTQR